MVEASTIALRTPSARTSSPRVPSLTMAPRMAPTLSFLTPRTLPTSLRPPSTLHKSASLPSPPNPSPRLSSTLTRWILRATGSSVSSSGTCRSTTSAETCSFAPRSVLLDLASRPVLTALRTQMDDQGWIEISVIANFNRIKNLTSDHAIVRETMGLTPILEVFGDFVRVRAHWPEWVLPNALPSRVDAKAVAAAAAVAVAAGEDQPASPGKDGEEGPASQGHSSEDDEEGTAPTTVSTGSQAGEETSMQKVVELGA